jgi:hypothetical protein
MQDINILVVVDTEYLRKTYPNPSKDPEKPTGIGHNDLYMICTGAQLVSNQARADLIFKATPGDEVSFRGTSISANSQDAVIVYGIKHWQPKDKTSDQVFNTFVADAVQRDGAAVPDENSENGLPALHKQINFLSFDSVVKKKGTEWFYVVVAVYALNSSNENQELWGYLCWDPTIEVQ